MLRGRKLGRGVKVAPCVGPTTRRAPQPSGVMVPTRWLKFIFAIFLLPVCAVLWLIAFIGLPRPILLYVFGHELTHALWVWLMGGRVSRFRVGRDGGHVVTNRTNFWIALAPYFFPLYSILAIAIYGLLSIFYNVQPYGRLLYAVIGATWAFHLTFTCWMIPKNQTDLRDHGTFFSLVVIYLLNLTLLSAMLILSSPHITFVSFGADLAKNIGNFAQWMADLTGRFVQGAQH